MIAASHHRDRAARWFRISAALWLLLPLDVYALDAAGALGASWATVRAIALILVLLVLPYASLSLWAAGLVADERSFCSALLGRAIAASNLIIALLYALAVGGVFGALFSSLLALASARGLALLGSRGLEAGDEADADFDPVRFRDLLILALIIASADASILGFSTTAGGVRMVGVVLAGGELGPLASSLVLTGGAALLMVVNVWGLLRLRIWALFGTMLGHLAITELALQGMLVSNIYVAGALALIAVAQLLLPIPILAAALGDQRVGRSQERLGRMVGLLVPALVVATMVTAALNLGAGLPEDWISPQRPG
ncbi:MAG: hypothetical protein R6X02_25800 [Enhygromyxa sp.]